MNAVETGNTDFRTHKQTIIPFPVTCRNMDLAQVEKTYVNSHSFFDEQITETATYSWWEYRGGGAG